MRRTVCIDFDGVIHDYDGRWKGHSSIEGGVVVDDKTGKSGIDVLHEYAEEFDVVILTTRGATVLGQEAVKRWLERNGADERVVAELVVTDEKPPALIYIDDRGFRFDGHYPTVDAIHRMLPWNRGGGVGVATESATATLEEKALCTCAGAHTNVDGNGGHAVGCPARPK